MEEGYRASGGNVAAGRHAPDGRETGVLAPPVEEPADSGPPSAPADGGGKGGGPPGDGGAGGERGLPIPAGKMGLILAMGSMSVLFAGLVAAYVVRMGMGGWESVHAAGMPVLWLNTTLLVATSGVLVVAARRVRRRGDRQALSTVVLAGLLGAGFLGGQGFAWQQLQEAGLYVATNPASSFFYLATALHGLHILGGLAAVAWAVGRLLREAGSPPGAARGGSGALAVELTGLYWHFLLAVWLVLFALMLVT